MLIRSFIFLIAGLIIIVFRVEFSNFKNKIIKKFNFKRKSKTKDYVYAGIIFIIISIILWILAIIN